MAQFNGVDIVPLPSNIAFKQIELVSNDTVAVSTSPYTQSQQVQAWPGADYWTASISLPSYNAHDARAVEAWLLSLRGVKNVFQIGHPLRTEPQGNPKGTPLASGTNLAMSTVLNTKGWAGNYHQLYPGDHIQIGYRLHVCLDSVTSDANGNASFNVWPSLREDIADGTPIQLYNAKGIFRLAENKRSVVTAETRLSAVQALKLVEVR